MSTSRTANVMFACKRSGHHAIINWFCQQHGNILHVNNVLPNHRSRQLMPEHTKYNLNAHGDKRDLLVNLEEIQMQEFVDNRYKTYRPLERADDYRYLVVLRRFKNMVASAGMVIHMIMTYDWDIKVDAYAEQLRAAKGEGHPLPNLYVILYDLWFEFPLYRKVICSDLGIPFTDAGLNEIPFYLGSSFDKMDYQGKAQQMQVLERWKQAADRVSYRYYMDRFKDVADASDAFFDEQRAKWCKG